MPSTPAVSTAINSPAWTACARHHCARQHCHQSGSKSVPTYYHARRRLAWPPNLRQVNHPARAACRVDGQCSRAGCQHLESLLSSVADARRGRYRSRRQAAHPSRRGRWWSTVATPSPVLACSPFPWHVVRVLVETRRDSELLGSSVLVLGHTCCQSIRTPI